MEKLREVSLDMIETVSLVFLMANRKKLQEAIEYEDTQSFNQFMENIANQEDLVRYFPMIVKVKNRCLIITEPILIKE